jgi:hypothetical protein
MKPLNISDPHIILAFQDEIRRSDEARYDHRLHSMLLVAQGMTCPEVAKKLGFDILVTIDCDCTYPAEKILDLLRAIDEGAGMVIGVRNMKNIRPLHRLPNKLHTLAINLLFFRFLGSGNWLHDINSGMRAFRLDKIRAFRSKGFDIEAEITIRAIKDGLKIREIPVEYEKRVGESKIRIKDGFSILVEIVKERFLP